MHRLGRPENNVLLLHKIMLIGLSILNNTSFDVGDKVTVLLMCQCSC